MFAIFYRKLVGVVMMMLLSTVTRASYTSSFMAADVCKNCKAESALHRLVKHNKSKFFYNARDLYGSSSLKTFMSSGAHVPPLSGNLVTVENCIDAFDDDSVAFVDGSWHLSPDRDGRKEYEAGPRISGAHFFDIDQVASKGEDLNPKNLPHMMPPKTLFAKVMDAMGIKNSNHVVIYGTEGCMFIPRAWYQFRAMGHDADKIHLMQGSILEWQNKNGPIDAKPKEALSLNSLDFTTDDTTYRANSAENVVGLDEVIDTVKKGEDATSIIIDVRAAGRFHAEVPEPRPGVKGGHMPGAYNVPFTDLIDDADYTKLRKKSDLEMAFKNAGIDALTDKKIICSCGSGVLACILAAALEECGRDPKSTVIYDGSWTEYGSDPNTIIAK